MKWEHIIGLMFLGWLIVWLLKYVVFGLAGWDGFFHPERLEADVNGPYKMFAKPFLGVFSNANNAVAQA